MKSKKNIKVNYKIHFVSQTVNFQKKVIYKIIKIVLTGLVQTVKTWYVTVVVAAFFTLGALFQPITTTSSTNNIQTPVVPVVIEQISSNPSRLQETITKLSSSVDRLLSLYGNKSGKPPIAGGSGGPRSITHGSSIALNADHRESTEFKTFNDLETQLTPRSEDHLLTKHGHNFKINDQLPKPGNDQTGRYNSPRTRLNQENRKTLRSNLQSALKDSQQTQYLGKIEVRGESEFVGFVAYNSEFVDHSGHGVFIGIDMNVPKGELPKIIKAQPLSAAQAERLYIDKKLE